MKKLFLSMFAFIMLFSLAGCTTPTETTTPTSQPLGFVVVKSPEGRITSPNVSNDDLSELVEGNSSFAFDMYQKLKEDSNGNLFYSPYSISTALAMTYAGARTETESQMRDTLHFTLPQNLLHPAFNKLSLELESRGQTVEAGKRFNLNINNALWGQKDYSFLPDFLKVLGQNYDAGMNVLDFITSPEESRITINDWVSNQTNNRIRDLLPQGSVNIYTRLVLTNAIYFDAAWKYPFPKDLTRNGTFKLLNNSTVSVPMMSHRAGFSYARGEGCQAVELPYEGNEISMVILLPDEGNFTAFDNALNYDDISDIIGNLQTTDMSLTMPKFHFDSSFSLKSYLAEMGMPLAFSEMADFSGINGNDELTITDVVHKAFVAVDEEGTEAAAASGVVVGIVSMPQTSVTIDRPFILLIRDVQTGAILFIGKVMNPS
jgi:serpin B